MTNADPQLESEFGDGDERERYTLVLPRFIMRRTHEHFQPYWEAGVETACYWFGHDAGRIQVVTTVAVPKLFQTSGNYRADPAGWRRLVRSMKGQRLVNLAQVHTHPLGYGVSHSRHDDQHAYSTREGALSIVFADFGVETRFDLNSVGVHERTGDGWRLLRHTEVSSRIRLVDDFADFRWEINGGDIEEYE